MPIIKSAMKRMRQEAVRRDRNRITKQALRREVKALERAVTAKDAKLASEKLGAAQKQLSISVKKNLLHKNTAARKLSRLNSLVKGLGAKPVVNKPAAKKSAPKPKPAKKA